ncbi:hypothetical protein Tco_0713999 [Tanacetum coccineum]
MSVRDNRPDCVLRDKFKNVKEALKKWSRNRFGGLDKKIEDYSQEAMRWELEAEKRSLGDVERKAWMEARRKWIKTDKEKAAAEGLNVIMQDAMDKGLYKGVGVGNDVVSISHLEYANDTIYILSKHNAKNLMCILKGFEKVSGLKINFNKSKVYGIGVSSSVVAEMARVMKCGMGELPLTYVGLPIGVSMMRESMWMPVIEKFKKRLTDWKAKTMSFGGGGRLTLVKYVLGSVPLVDHDALWCRVVRSIHGADGGEGVVWKTRRGVE